MRPLRVALAKGRLAAEAVSLLTASGFELPGFGRGRSLVVPDSTGRLEVVLVKSDDIPVYVEKGAADLGVVGKDVLVEQEPRVYELLDLQFGRAQMCVAGTQAWDPSGRKVVVGSKYPRTARRHFTSLGIPSEVVELHGSVELAPLLGLVDVIVDIVETGATLRDNNLAVLETLFDVTARLVTNQVSLRTRQAEVAEVLSGMRSAVAKKESVS